MGSIVPSSIRSKLFLLGVLVSVPVILLFVINSWHQRKSEVEKEAARMRNILDFVVLQEEQVIRGTRNMMAALAEVPAVREGGNRCDEYLRGFLDDRRGYLNMGVARPDGQVFCNSRPVERPFNISGREHFRGALEDRRFQVGRYITSVFGGKPILPFAHPVLDGKGRVISVLFCSIDLSAATEIEEKIRGQIPAGSVFLKLDENGTVLTASSAVPGFEVGKGIDRTVFERMSHQQEGRIRHQGADGVERLLKFASLRGNRYERGEFVALGIPTAALTAEPVRLLVANLSALTLVGLAFYAVLWYAGNALIVRPVRILTEASKRLAAGDLSVRTGLKSAAGEFGALGRSFDEMAAALERGESESRRLQEDLKKAATEAGNEKAKSEAIIAAIGDGINIVDRNFRILYQNDVHRLQLGDHVGKFCYQAYHGRDAVCSGCLIDLAFRTGKIHTGEIERIRNGERFFNEITASPLRDASGEIVAGIEVVRDVTERKETERRVSRSVKMLSALHRVDLNILRGIGLEETLGVVCDAIVRMGYPACRVALVGGGRSGRVAVARGEGKEIFEELDLRWDDPPPGREAFGTVVRTGQTFLAGDISADARFAPWKERFAECGLRSLVALPLKSDDGTVVGVLVVCSDVPDGFSPEDIGDMETFAQQSAVAILSAKWMENLRDVNQRLLFHVNRMPMGYIVWDKDFRVTEWNPAAERIFGWEAHEAIGRRGTDFLIPKEHLDGVESTWRQLKEGEETTSLNENLRKDGRRIRCEWFNGPLQDNEGNVTGVLSIVHDVTEKVYMERQLQTAQRMEAVGTLAGGVAHDFNNALTGIFGFGEMLRPYLKGDANASAYLNEVMRSAERAATLTRQLLTYSRRQAVSLSTVSMDDIVRDLFKLLAKVAGERIEIRLRLAGNLPAIHADPGQIEQVLMNLVINARDAMPTGGRIGIETSLATLDEDSVRYHPHMSAGSFVVLTVSDTGVGMDAKTQERIFDPFFTTKGPSKGTGLGLAMVYGIVKQHGGFIHLYSEPGKGSTFRVYLPPAPGTPQTPAPPAPPELHGGTETILLAEDDELVRALVEDTLKNLGYTVLTATNGQEAVLLFGKHRGSVALALFDVAMPVMGGKEAYEAIHAIAPELKVLFMSGYASDEGGETFLLVTGAPFLPKPFGPAELGRKVRALLDGE